MPPMTAAQPPSSAFYSPLDAVDHGWKKFRRNALPFLVLTLLILGVGVLVQGGTNLATTGNPLGIPQTDPVTGLPDQQSAVTQLASGAASLLSSIISWALGFALMRGALDVVDTGRTSLGAMFTRIPWGQAIIAGLLTAAALFVGLLLCILPMFVVMFLLYYVTPAVLDGESGVDALTASYRFTSRNLGPNLLLLLIALLLGLLSLCTLGLAYFVVIPVMSIAVAYTWRMLQGRPVAPAV